MAIQVELVTPEKLAFSDQVDFLVVPAWDGELGILPEHTPLLAKLGPGEMRLERGNETRYVVITGGFVEVQHGSKVSVFAETAEFADEIDVERARQAAERAKKQLERPTDLTGMELAEVEAALSRAVMRIKVGESRWRKQKPEGVH